MNKYNSLVLEDDEQFECLVIKRGDIDHLNWNDINYAAKLMELDIIKTIIITKSNFNEMVATNLEIDKYNISTLEVKKDIFGEDANYVYEMCYVDLNDYEDFKTPENINNLASIICLSEDKIYSNIILFKNYIPENSEECTISSLTKKDLELVIHNRVYTKIVTYDSLNIDFNPWTISGVSVFTRRAHHSFFDSVRLETE